MEIEGRGIDSIKSILKIIELEEIGMEGFMKGNGKKEIEKLDGIEVVEEDMMEERKEEREIGIMLRKGKNIEEKMMKIEVGIEEKLKLIEKIMREEDGEFR